MKKALLLLFGVIVGLPAISQIPKSPTGYWIGEVTRLWIPKRVDIKDSMSYKYLTHGKYDTAHVHNSGMDTFEVVTVPFKSLLKTKPPVLLPDIISTLDDNTISSAQAYSPATNAGNNIYITTGWSHFINQPWNSDQNGNAIHHNKSYSFVDQVPGAYIEVTCNPCYKIEWWSEKRENHGIVAITLDNGTPSDIDLYMVGTANNSLLLYTTPSLPNTTHKLRITYTGRKNPAAISTNIGHDKFVIYQQTMKNSLLIFFLLIALTSCGQKKLPTKEVEVTDGEDL